MGYIPSSGDPERTYFQERQAYYARYDITMPIYFELDVIYQPDLLDRRFACDAIHLTGGNTYYSLHWLRKRKLIKRLREYVAWGGVLVGVSAGAILMTEDISTAALCGDEPIEEQNPSGLELVDFAFVPHIEGIALSRLHIGKLDLKEALEPLLSAWGWRKSVEDFMDIWFEVENAVDTRVIGVIRVLQRAGLTCYLATNQERYRAAYMKTVMGRELLPRL